MCLLRIRRLIETGQARQSVHYNDWRGGIIDTIVGRDTLNVNCLILYVFYNKILSIAHIQQRNLKRNSNTSTFMMFQYRFYFKI